MSSPSSWVRTQDASSEIDRIHKHLLAEISATPEDSPVRHHLWRAKNFLLEFKEEFLKILEERMNAVKRTSQRTIPRTVPTYYRRLPTLFAGRQHVCTLLLYNMHKVSKKAIGDMLLACGQEEFRIDMVFFTGQRCSARITCDNIASSTKMQCDALLNKIFFKGGKKSESGKRYVKVCPFKENEIPTSPPLDTQVPVELSPACLEAFRLDSVLATIIKYLDNDSKMALITAFERWLTVQNKIGYLHFDSGSWRYQTTDGLRRMKNDACQFHFRSITIRESSPLDVSDFQSLLNINLGKQSIQEERKYLITVDLRGLIATPTILEWLTKYFSVETLIIGKTTGFFEKKVSLEGVICLSVHDNPLVRLSWMKDRPDREDPDLDVLISWFSSRAGEKLTSIKLNNCLQIRVEPLILFVDNNKILKELSLTDCANIDQRLQMWQLSERIFNTPNELRIFRMEQNNLTIEPLNLTHEPVFRTHPFLVELSLKGSRCIEQFLQMYIDHAPALQVVDFTGLDIPQEKLNFSNTRSLTVLKLSYHRGIESTLDSLSTLQVRDVLIINTLSKNDEKNNSFCPRFVADVITRVPYFKFVAVGCKIYLPDTTRRYVRAFGAYISPREPGTNGALFYERFEVKNNID